MKKIPKGLKDNKIASFEWYWNNYIAKIARVDELVAMGRYGFQLRMPNNAVRSARTALIDWCNANGVEVPTCVGPFRLKETL
jgi:hypothetical protein